MASFALICVDKPDSLSVRLAAREAHLAYIRAAPEGFLRIAGPMISEAGEMCGSLLLIEAPDAETVQAFSDADPYTLAGLFERVEVRAWRPTTYQPTIQP
jgi:uncharacterized protein YciI